MQTLPRVFTVQNQSAFGVFLNCLASFQLRVYRACKLSSVYQRVLSDLKCSFLFFLGNNFFNQAVQMLDVVCQTILSATCAELSHSHTVIRKEIFSVTVFRQIKFYAMNFDYSSFFLTFVIYSVLRKFPSLVFTDFSSDRVSFSFHQFLVCLSGFLLSPYSLSSFCSNPDIKIRTNSVALMIKIFWS